MTLTQFSEKDNCLYINTNALIPQDIQSGLKTSFRSQEWKDASKAYREFNKKSMEDKIAGSSYKDQIQVEIDAHPGCLLSEFMDA